jgi:hypothetical protein
MKKMILALAALAAMSARAQENLVDRVFEVKDKSGMPLLRITNVKTKPTFGATLRNVSGVKLDMLRTSALYLTYTTRGESEKAWIVLCDTGDRCEIPEDQLYAIQAATFLPAVLNSVDFGLSDSGQHDAEVQVQAKIKADRAKILADEADAKVHEVWKKQVAIKKEADAVAAKRKAPTEAVAAKRKAAAEAAEAKRKAPAEAAEAKQKAAAEAADPHLIGVIILVVIGFVLYWVPTIIACRKHKRNSTAICVLNFFFGWTVIGWFGALIWALTVDEPAR